MEKRKYVFWDKLFCAATIIQFSMLTQANFTTTSSQIAEDSSDSSAYAWSSWGSWSPCSRTCGGGVAIQERECLPRKKNPATNTTLAPPEIIVRVTRQIPGDCPGEARRYHECNTAPCPGGLRDMRAEQCAAYDRRPFRGRFYTWVPYIDGDSPCTLNCRPLGQHFYASLSLVADGTPCTRPGFRAICVQGVCKVVGRETVLAAAGTPDIRCGRRLVSGLFTRPRLPLGYSYVATVPRGACRLNVSEILPSENYIALKISNSSYIINGEFAVSAPGTYEAAGTRFIYTRAAGLDRIFALGPIHHSIDIMVLYTEPNPSIKYEYFTESIPGEIDTETVTRTSLPDIMPSLPKHNRRHHGYEAYARPGIGLSRFPDLTSMSKESSSAEDGLENVVGTRRFVWKIMSYTQCTRSCGGGIQLGKYRCVEVTSGIDREVSSVHCSGSPPTSRRRRCGNVPCQPRWRAAAWSQCPQCGPASRTRIVGCVQDHSRGIIKVSDQKCTTPKPATTEPCNIPDCEVTKLETKKVLRPREHKDHFRDTSVRENTDNFRDGPVYTVAANNTDLDIGPAYSFSTAGWLYTEWSDCVGWCVGSGIQTRGVRCADPSGCAPRKAPESSRTCTLQLECQPHDGQWYTGDWSQCSSPCKGKQVRGVLCIGNNGRHLRETACMSPKPEHERECGDNCTATWYFGDWGQCVGNCSTGVGVQRRSVMCMKSDDSVNGTDAGGDKECGNLKPESTKECSLLCTTTTLPPDLSIESHKTSGYETTTTRNVYIDKEKEDKDCEDKLHNCALAVQARLCHYNYYVQNCCSSCNGR